MADKDQRAGPPGCGQCGRPAIMLVGGVPLCVDCEYKFQQSRYMVFAQNAAMLNMAHREMDEAVGMGHYGDAIKIPPAPVPPIHYNNQSISVSGGTVGSINFGQVDTMRVDIHTLTQGGAVTQAEALVSVVNAVLDAPDLTTDQKNGLLEQLAFVTKEAATPAPQRKPSVLKSVLGTIKEAAGATGAVATAWSVAEPIVRAHLGL